MRLAIAMMMLCGCQTQKQWHYTDAELDQIAAEAIQNMNQVYTNSVTGAVVFPIGP